MQYVPPKIEQRSFFVRLRRKPRACPWMNAKRNKLIAAARCHPKDKADNRGVADSEDAYFNGTTDLLVGVHISTPSDST